MPELADVRSLLEAASPATLTTYRRDGSALTTPVWFRWTDDGAFEVVLAEGDVKLGHLARDPRCSLLVFEKVRPFRGVEVRGTARLEQHDDVTSFREAIAGKYLGPAGGEAFAAGRRSRRGYVLRIEAERTRIWDLAAALPDAAG